MEIFKLIPIGRESLWGGTRLIEKYGKNIELNPLAESWECSTHPGGINLVATGKYKGQKLSSVLKRNSEFLGKKYKKSKQLPILVKFIDANKDLSVQVHPNDRFAKKYEKQNGKTEMWYIVEAKKNAKLIYGFEHPVTDKILTEAIQTGEIEKHLHYEPVHAGDTFFIPAGTVHGIGSGLLIAEIQQSSDVTYRVYDYNRVDKYGNKRALNVEKALKVMNKRPVTDRLTHHKLINYFPGGSRQLLQSSSYFQVEKIRLNGSVKIDTNNMSFQIMLCLDGEGQIKYDRKAVDFFKGDCIFVSAGNGSYTVLGQNTFLKING